MCKLDGCKKWLSEVESKIKRKKAYVRFNVVFHLTLSYVVVVITVITVILLLLLLLL